MKIEGNLFSSRSERQAQEMCSRVANFVQNRPDTFSCATKGTFFDILRVVFYSLIQKLRDFFSSIASLFESENRSQKDGVDSLKNMARDFPIQKEKLTIVRFALWWQNSFDSLNGELQKRVLLEDIAMRFSPTKTEEEAFTKYGLLSRDYVRNLSRWVASDGGIQNPRDTVGNLLNKVINSIT